jgi:hypothetical protein
MRSISTNIVWDEPIGHNVSTGGGLLDLLACGEGNKVGDDVLNKDGELEKKLMAKVTKNVGTDINCHRHYQGVKNLGFFISHELVVWDDDLDEVLDEMIVDEVILDEEPQQFDEEMGESLECKHVMLMTPIMSNSDVEGVLSELSRQVGWDEVSNYPTLHEGVLR